MDDIEQYIRSFATFAQVVDARYAVPFASNHCHLHKDVYAFNNIVQTPRLVQEFFDAHGIERPELKILLSGDSWSSDSGFDISPATMDYFDRRDEYLERYRQENAAALEKFYAEEDRAVVKLADVEEHFHKFFDTIPVILRDRFRGHPIRYVLTAGARKYVYEIDVANRRVRELTEADLDPENPLEIHTSAYIFNHAMMMNILSCVSTSKRVRYRVTSKNIKYMKLFNFIIDLHYCELLPLQNNFSKRSITSWLERWRELVVLGRAALDYARTGAILEEKFLTEVKVCRDVRPLPERPWRSRPLASPGRPEAVGASTGATADA